MDRPWVSPLSVCLQIWWLQQGLPQASAVILGSVEKCQD